MGDYLKIYRRWTPRGYFLKAFNNENYEYMWVSRSYPWLWLAKWHGIKAARKYLAGKTLASDHQVDITSLRKISHGDGFFEQHKVPGGTVSRIFIEQVNL